MDLAAVNAVGSGLRAAARTEQLADEPVLVVILRDQ